jgi:hypothetical protein
MKTTKFLTITILALMFFVVSAHAQKKTTKKTTPAKPTAAATNAAAAAEIRAGADKVSIQLNNVAVFAYKLGGIATGLEDMEKAARTKPLSPAAAKTHNGNKQAVIQLIHGLQVGLAALEVEFRTKPNLKKFQFNIGGVANLAGQSEDLAAAGQFTESGKMLLQVIQKLSDTLVAMP